MTAAMMVAVAMLFASGCGKNDVTVKFLRSDHYSFSRTERNAIQAIADDAVADARPLLPALPDQLTFTVRVGTDVIDLIGATASAMPWWQASGSGS